MSLVKTGMMLIALLGITGCKDDSYSPAIDDTPYVQINPKVVSTQVGVCRSESAFLGLGVSHVDVTNSDEFDQTNARVRLIFTLSCGDAKVKRFFLGNLKRGQKWEKKLDWMIRDVACIDILYVCDQGSRKGTLELKN